MHHARANCDKRAARATIPVGDAPSPSQLRRLRRHGNHPRRKSEPESRRSGRSGRTRRAEPDQSQRARRRAHPGAPRSRVGTTDPNQEAADDTRLTGQGTGRIATCTRTCAPGAPRRVGTTDPNQEAGDARRTRETGHRKPTEPRGPALRRGIGEGRRYPPCCTSSETTADRGWLRRLGGALRPHRRNVVIALGAATVGQVIAALIPLVERHIIDNSSSARRPRSGRRWRCSWSSPAPASCAAYVRRFWAGRVSLDVQHDLRTAIFDQLQRLDFAAPRRAADRSARQPGELRRRADPGAPAVPADRLGERPAVRRVARRDALAVAAAHAGRARRSRRCSLSCRCGCGTSVFPATWDAQQQAGDVADVVEEDVTGVRVVKGFGQEERELDRLADRPRRPVRPPRPRRADPGPVPAGAADDPRARPGGGARARRLARDPGPASRSARSSRSPPTCVQLTPPVRMLAGMLTVGQQARAGAERIFDLLDSTPLVPTRPTRRDARDHRAARCASTT